MDCLVYLTDSLIPSTRAGCLHSLNQFKALQQLHPQVRLVAQKGNFEWQEIGFEKIAVDTVESPKGKGGLLWLTLWFRKRIKLIKPTAVYSRFVLFPLCFSKSHYVLELHDDAWNKGFLFGLALRIALKSKRCLGFTSITQAIKEDFDKKYPDSRKQFWVLPDAAHIPDKRYSAEFREHKPLTIGYVGSLYEGKGLSTILRIAQELKNHHFLIIGGKDAQVEELKARHPLPNVEFTGFVPQSDIWQYMSSIDICLLPNKPSVKTGKKTDIGRYTSPLKMFEYMSYSKPIIASDLKVLREVLTSDCAKLVPHDDVESWVKAISALENPADRKLLGSNAYQVFIDNFTWEKRASKILGILTA